MAPLNDEEKKFAEENHNLIYPILRRFNRPLDDYDLAAEAYVKAVRTWFKRPELREKYAFATIFSNAMRGVLSNETSNLTAEKRVAPVLVYIDAPARGDGSTIDNFISDDRYVSVEDQVSDLEPRIRKTLNHAENFVLDRLILGYTQREIGRMFGCSQTYINHLVKCIKAKTLVVQGAAV